MILRGPDGLKQFLSVFSTAFPDSRAEITNVFATEEHAVVEAILRGTHTGVMHSPAGDIPPAAAGESDAERWCKAAGALCASP